MSYKSSYLPVDPDFDETLRGLIQSGGTGKVHFFDPENQVEDAFGTLKGIVKTKNGEFLQLGDHQIRLDKIITVMGKPGPSYDEYDTYANACLTCFDPSVN